MGGGPRRRTRSSDHLRGGALSMVLMGHHPTPPLANGADQPNPLNTQALALACLSTDATRATVLSLSALPMLALPVLALPVVDL